MYERFYGFSELPFELTANPKYLFLSSRQREALSTLQYGLFAAKSITLLIGEAGTGKTTLIRAALESERCKHVRCIYLNNPALRPDDFLRLLNDSFGRDWRNPFTWPWRRVLWAYGFTAVGATVSAGVGMMIWALVVSNNASSPTIRVDTAQSFRVDQ